MIKDLLQSKTKSYKKPWPENCAWPEPKFYGVKYDENLDGPADNYLDQNIFLDSSEPRQIRHRRRRHALDKLTQR